MNIIGHQLNFAELDYCVNLRDSCDAADIVNYLSYYANSSAELF